MPNDRHSSLREGSRMALQFGGVGVLREPDRFVSYLSDVTDCDSPEMFALFAWCDEDFLAPFALAANERTSMGFETAILRGIEYLANRSVDCNVATSICGGIALGVQDALGMTPSSLVSERRAGAEEHVVPQPSAPNETRDVPTKAETAASTTETPESHPEPESPDDSGTMPEDDGVSVTPLRRLLFVVAFVAVAAAICLVVTFITINSGTVITSPPKTKVVSVSAGGSHTVALRSDGTVLATGSNDAGQCDVSGWRCVTTVSAGDSHTVAVLSDGRVNGMMAAKGSNSYDQCFVSYWADIVKVATGHAHTVALRSDGMVYATGANYRGQCDVSGWTDVVAVSAGGSHTVGVRYDGTVLAVGDNTDSQCDVSGWTEVVAVSAGGSHTVALRSDGTVLATGSNADGQCDVSNW